MPLYEYRCEACGKTEEKLESISAPMEHACSACGQEGGMKRQFSQVAVNFVGGGWYAEGYSGPSKPKEGVSIPKPSSAGCCGGSCACKH